MSKLRKPKKKTSGKGKKTSRKASRKSPSKGKKTSNSRARGRIHTELVTELPELRSIKVKSRSNGSKKKAVTQPGGNRDPLDVERIMQRLDNTYLDEIGAFLLIAFGILCFVTLISPSGGALGDALSGWLATSFGFGAYLIALAIIAGGILLLLPKIDILIVPNWWRLLWAEVFFVTILAYYQATLRYSIGGEEGRIEAFARAAEGRGGGLVGWAIQEALHAPLGDLTTGAILLGVLLFSGALTLGLTRNHILGALGAASTWLTERAHGLQPLPTAKPVAKAVAVAPELPPSTSTPKPQPTVPAPPSTPKPAPHTPDVEKPVLPTEKPAAGQQPVKPQPAEKADTQEVPPQPEGEPTAPLETGPRLGVALTLEERVALMQEEGQLKERFEVTKFEDKKKIRKRSDDLPPLELLSDTDYERPTSAMINYYATMIEKTIEDFGMQVEVVDVKTGPSVTQYAVQPFTHIEKDGKKVVQRVRVTKVASLGQDISLALSARSVRIQAPVPGTNYIGVEVPNRRPGTVSLRPVIESEQFYRLKSNLALALGRQVDGSPFAADLSKMPHLLIGGTTGSGKSVALRAITTCLVMNNTPDRLRLILIDPKMVEMIRFNGLPHLLGKVEVQLDRALGVLRWVTREMDRRYKLMEEAQSRNIFVYNKGRRRKNRLPHIVVIIDELAELMNEFGDQTEHLITRLAQMARATGIHLIVATQRPSTDVITGLIKANFPARIAFAVASNTDSRVIIDSVGAEELIGQGDMLFQAADAAGPIRLQGCFIGDEEIENVVSFWEDNWSTSSQAKKKKVAPWERALTRAAILSRTDPLLEDAIKLVQQEREASASMIQRRLNVGYPRAGRLIDLLETLGVVGDDPGGGRTRPVLIDEELNVTDYLIDHSELLD